jgi:membrane protease YdiL (CAAX protease family)
MQPNAKARTLAESLLWFGLPGLTILACVHWLVPRLVSSSLPLLHAWTLSIIGPTVFNAAAVITYYVVTHWPDRTTFLQRFRLLAPSWRTVALVPVIALLILALNESLAWTVPLLREVGWSLEPPIQPSIFKDSYAALEAGGNVDFMGIELGPTTWWVIPYWLFFWPLLGGLGEELVWRGYLLPKQEAAFGRWAWLLNGMLWNVPFHLYTATAVFSDMPFFLLLPLATQKVGNTWFAWMVHALLASLALVVIVPSVW